MVLQSLLPEAIILVSAFLGLQSAIKTSKELEKKQKKAKETALSPTNTYMPWLDNSHDHTEAPNLSPQIETYTVS